MKLSGLKSCPNVPDRTLSIVPGSRSTSTARGTNLCATNTTHTATLYNSTLRVNILFKLFLHPRKLYKHTSLCKYKYDGSVLKQKPSLKRTANILTLGFGSWMHSFRVTTWLKDGGQLQCELEILVWYVCGDGELSTRTLIHTFTHLHSYTHTHTRAAYHILTARLIVVHVNSLQLKDRVSCIVACWINAMFITYDFPELRQTKKKT